MFLHKCILNDSKEDSKSFTEILFEKMNQINRFFYIMLLKMFNEKERFYQI
jgi:hypothetical protein